jgi:hypothetical protein
MSDTIVQTIRYTLGLFIPLASVAYVLERDESGYVFVAGALLSLTVAGVLFATWWAVLFMPPVIVVGFIVITFSSGGRGLGAEYHGPISEVVLFLLVIFSLFVPRLGDLHRVRGRYGEGNPEDDASTTVDGGTMSACVTSRPIESGHSTKAPITWRQVLIVDGDSTPEDLRRRSDMSASPTRLVSNPSAIVAQVLGGLGITSLRGSAARTTDRLLAGSGAFVGLLFALWFVLGFGLLVLGVG